MASPNPKFDRYIKDSIYQHNVEKSMSRYGIIHAYDAATNTATVQLSGQHSDELGETLTKVPCPVIMGVQTVAPEPGRPCWVVFKGGSNDSRAVISHYFNFDYRQFDYPRLTPSENIIPSYMIGM